MTTTGFPQLPPRANNTHKGDYGHALLIGGSMGMSGAIALSAQAALHSGAGLVTVATPETCQATVASFNPCYMTIPLPADQQGKIEGQAYHVLEPALQRATCLALGPGLGRSDDLVKFTGQLYTTWSGPAVFDADGLNALANDPHALQHPAGVRILTPHPGEFQRLSAAMQFNQETPAAQRAVLMAEQLKAVVLLKGHRTLITDGRSSFENQTGNPGMATGGTGDVLTGILVALLGQGLQPLDAARLGAYVHGLAGDMAADRLGQVSLTAVDLIEFLPASFESIRQAPPSS